MTLELRSTRFRAERQEAWLRLERLLGRAERGGARELTDDELVSIPALYRSALSSLNTARAISLDQALIDYLEALCARAYVFVYGARARLGERVGRFFAHDWPAAVRALWPETLVAALAMLLGAALSYSLVSADPEWFYSVIPAEMAQGRTPAASTQELRATLYGQEDEEGRTGLGVFAAFLFTHNAQIAIGAFALGFAFGAPSVLLLVFNGAVLGAFVQLFVSRGLGGDVGGWLLIHGVTELWAVTLAGAAGMSIGRALAYPGRRTRLEAAADAGRRAGVVIAGVVVMLAVAGLLEGVGRQVVTSTPLRYAVAAATAVFWGAYFFRPGGSRG
ncbi:MAG: stage II sporulation protein M [Proteobacteria bacterium]|nr:stage II sporulation protein M [Pseudomonadota bacterium]